MSKILLKRNIPHRFIMATQIFLLQSNLIPASSVSMGLFLNCSVVSDDLSTSEEISDFGLNFSVLFLHTHSSSDAASLFFFVTSKMNSEKFNDSTVQAWL